MSSNQVKDTELSRLLAQVLSETPTVSRKMSAGGEGGTSGGDSRGRSVGVSFEGTQVDRVASEINHLTIANTGTAGAGETTTSPGTSLRRVGNSLFVDIGQAGTDATAVVSEGGLQMLSARSSGSSTIESLLDVTPLKYHIYQFPLSLEETAALCSQRQSGGITACIRSNCKLNHRGPKVVFRPGTMVVAKSSQSVFIEPTTHHTSISNELYKEWQRNPRTLDEWSDVFQVVNAQGPSEVFTPESLLAAQTFHQYAKDFRSPTRTVNLSDLPFGEKSTLFSGMLNSEIEKVTREVQSKQEVNARLPGGPLCYLVLTGEQEIDDSFKRLECSNEVNKLLLFSVGDKLDETADTVNEELRVLLTRTQGLESTVGQRVLQNNNAFEAATVWGTIALLAAALDTLQINTSDLATTTAGAFGEMEKGMTTSFESQLQEVVVNTSIMVANQMNHALDKVAVNERSLGQIHDTLMMLARGANKLKEEVAELRDVTDKLTFGDDRVFNIPKTVSTADSTVLTDISSLKGMMRALGLRMDSVIEGRESKAVKFFGNSFRGHGEAENWVAENLDNKSFGLVVDAHLVFEHVYHQAFSDDGSVKELNGLYKLKIDNITQGLAISSFDHPMPKFLSVSTNSLNKKPKIKKNDASHFDNIDTYEDWDLPIMGFRAKLKEQLEEFEETHVRMIQEVLGADEPAYRVATMSVQASVGWIQNFIAYLDETYMDTARLQSFTSQRAWQLVTQIGRRILTDVAGPRNGVKKLFRVGDNLKIAQAMFWPMVQCHELMGRYKKANFKDDPSVSNEFMKFMATNSGSTDGLTPVLAKLNKMENEFKEALKAGKGASTSAATSSNKVDEIKKLVNSLADRLSRLERSNQGGQKK